ncbi:MAG: XRE family transcriptional regulator [Gammaproteobacteria bacterium]
MDTSSALGIDSTQVQALAKNLRTLLDSRGVSEGEIAQSLGIPVMTVRRIVSGETADPRISTLKLIAKYFDVSIDLLLENNDEKMLPFMAKRTPQFVPILDWKTAGDITDCKQIDLSTWKKWHPIVFNNHSSLSDKVFALESRPSMQPRFPTGTLFIIEPDEPPTDGDIILIKMKTDGDLSLRELVIDPPKWQLQPIVAGSEVLFYNKNQHHIVGVVILSMLHNRKEI